MGFCFALLSGCWKKEKGFVLGWKLEKWEIGLVWVVFVILYVKELNWEGEGSSHGHGF